MKKVMKAVGITAALAVMIPLSAYAATSTSGTTSTVNSSEAISQSRPAGDDFGRGPGHGFKGGALDQTVLDLLKLDETTLQTKIKEGKTLIEVAEEQGVTREALKTALTDSFTKKQDEQKQKFTENLDKVIDGKLSDQIGGRGHHGGKFGGKQDLSAIATALGVTADELRESVKGGKSIADLAAEKKVDAQTLIDAQKTAIIAQVNKELAAGNLTQEQADKQIASAAARAEDIVNGTGFGRGERGSRQDDDTAEDNNASTTG
ncbi:hypothetical protein [Paenibacillus nasutitermitis]|uniref:Uncharacterized protein n=1 Tax=Paenibacillus nasutitermitis TaxID=1652958 RepID=A0A917E3M7_9BACL|nr:hypothetical protein [Paenibacillus nasutitermitis]GGE01722.1 hypothetical protein GCM10010911_70850 [Paenibacillus nasutitermitis]